jgi:putative DNA methylase
VRDAEPRACAGHPARRVSLSTLLHSWKSFTAKAINVALARRGPVWFEEYFDRRIRDEAHYAATLTYIENNPVAAALCSKATAWEFSSAAGKRAERARHRGRLTGRAVG